MKEEEYLNCLNSNKRTNSLELYITGVIGPYVVFQGNEDFDFDLCVKSIYYMYTDLNDKRIYDFLNEAIDKIAVHGLSIKCLYGLVRFCETHKNYDDNGLAPFKINYDEILLKIKKNLIINKELYASHVNNSLLNGAKNYVESKVL